MSCGLPKINFPCFSRSDTEASAPTSRANSAGQPPARPGSPHVPTATNASVAPPIYAPNAGRHRGQLLNAAFRRSSNDSIRANSEHESAYPQAGASSALQTGPEQSMVDRSDAGAAAILPGDARLQTIEGRLEAGRQVLESVCSIYEHTAFKANNKLNTKLDLADERARAQMANAEAEKVFNQYTNIPLATTLAAQVQGHNCYTLSLLALDGLDKLGVQRCMVSTTAHACVAMGPIPKGGKLPADMRHWPKEIGICDPWCHIVCPAPEYPDRFKEKMAEWKSDGMLIIDGSSAEIAPDEQNWMNEVLNGGRNIHIGDLWTKP